LSISIRKLGVLAAVAALLVVLAALRPTAQTPVAQADMAAPGGIAALPSAVPAIPGVANQGIPAIIGTGQPAIVVAFCSGTGGVIAPCAVTDPVTQISGPVKFQLTQVYPTSGAVPMATFAASGSDTVVVSDNGGADMDAAPGVVAVEVDAGAATQAGTKGVNEIVKVTASDATGGVECPSCWGDQRSTTIVVVDTMLAWGPSGQISTASQDRKSTRLNSSH
jgi:hypothetical protein